MQQIKTAILSVFILWFSGFLLFIYGIPKKPVDTTSPTDAIVVWTGGPCRITTGVELLDQGLSNRLLVSGVEPPRPKLIGRQCKSDLSFEAVEALRPKIDFGYSALSTMGNAIETAKWVKANHVRSVRLVTTPVHMPRSMIEFRQTMPDVVVISNPVNVRKFDHRGWYCSWHIFSKVSLEYSKYLVVRLGIRPWWRDNILEGQR